MNKPLSCKSSAANLRIDVIAWVTPAVHELAMEMFRKYSDQEFSVVDCASFVVAKRKNIREVFSFDSDFAKMGFILRP